MQPLPDKHFTLPAAELVRLVHDTRERTLALVADLDAAQFDVPLHALVNPLRWELGHVAFFYEPFVEDRVFTFRPEYNAQSLKMVFSPEGEFADPIKKINMPPDFVFVNRIQWGVYSILSKLNATNNWHHIHREYLLNGPPSTDLERSAAVS